MITAHFTTSEPTKGKKLSSIIRKVYGSGYGYVLFGDNPWASATGRVISPRGEIVGTILEVTNSKGERLDGATLEQLESPAR